MRGSSYSSKYWFVFAVVGLLFCFSATGAWAATGKLYINGTEVVSDLSVDGSNTGWSWAATTATLTLSSGYNAGYILIDSGNSINLVYTGDVSIVGSNTAIVCNGSLTISGGSHTLTLTNTSGPAMNVLGALTVQDGTLTAVGVTIVPNSHIPALFVAGSVAINNGGTVTVSNTGPGVSLGLNSGQSLMIASGATLNFGAGSFQPINCTIVNNGTINNSNKGFNIVGTGANGSFTNNGTFTNNAGGILHNNLTITNNGTIVNNTGCTIVNNDIGTIVNSNTGTITNDGTLTNNGTINDNGTISNTGTIDGSATALNTVKNLFVGAQSGILTAGTAGEATYTVTTSNIANGTAITLNGGVTGITLYTATNATTSDSTQVKIKTTTGVSAGTYPLTLKIDGITSAPFNLVVGPGSGSTPGPSPSTVSVTGVTMSKATLDLKTGETGQLTATVAPSDATSKDVTWTTSNANVATVDQNGKVTAIGQGTATITVTTVDGGKTATCTVTVTQSGSSNTVVTIDLSNLGLENGILKLDINELYSAQLKATPTGTTFTATGLPQGLTLTSGGLLSGSVPTEGTYNVTLTATAPDGTKATQAFVVEVKGGTATVTGGGSSSGCNAGFFGGLLVLSLAPLLRRRDG